MSKVVIIGAGQSGLQLAIGLRQQGLDVTVVSNRTGEDFRTGRVMSSQCMFANSLDTERKLGIDFWDDECPPIEGISLAVPNPEQPGEKAIDFASRLDRPAQATDQRVKYPRFMEHLESIWAEPDEGIWEVRGPRRHFTHSKMMAWVALDRAVKGIEQLGLDGPAARWREVRDTIHDQICRQGYDRARNTFVQYYGARELDASLLMMPLVGFLPPGDPRVRGTVEAIERELLQDGFVMRYAATPAVDGLPPGEGVFLACTFWLADNYALLGRRADARHCFERLLELRNDVGLLSEQYDTVGERLVGNFPQAFTHVALVNTAHNLDRARGPARVRGEEER